MNGSVCFQACLMEFVGRISVFVGCRQEASLSSRLSGFCMRQRASSGQQLEGKGAVLGPAHSRKGICTVLGHWQVGITGGHFRKLPTIVHLQSLIIHVPSFAKYSLTHSLNVFFHYSLSFESRILSSK